MSKLRYMHAIREARAGAGSATVGAFRYYANSEAGPVLVNEKQRAEMRVKNQS